MGESSFNIGAAIGGIALAGAVAFAGIQLGDALIAMKKTDRIVTVKGLSETEVQADIANWRLPFRGEGEDGPSAIAKAEKSGTAIRAFALAGGISEAETTDEPYAIRIERMFINSPQGGQEERVRYIAVGAVRLRSENVVAVEALASKTDELLTAGVLLGDNDYAEAAKPEYLFTRLNDIKPAILKEATEAARRSAAQFAEDSGAAVGDIASADQGVIQILPRDGQYEQRLERNKIVRVVSTVRYYLTSE